MTLMTIPDVEAGTSERSKMLPRSTDATLPGDLIHRIFWWKYVWILLLLSLIVGDIVLDNTPFFISPQVTRRRGDTSDWNDALSPIEQPSKAAGHGSPPSGFPWHRWSSPSIEVRLLVEELGLIDELSVVKELSDPKQNSMNLTTPPTSYNTTFQPTIYRTLIPYVVRNGTAFHSKRKETMLNTKRWPKFESILSDALKLARELQDVDPRLAALVTQEFPFILAQGDKPWCCDRNGKVIPIFSWFTIKDCGYSWPVPDYHFCSRKMASTKDWEQQFSEWNQEYPWESKIQKAVWRGTMTGPNMRDWRDKPRAKLVQRSILDQQRTLDAAFAEHPLEKRTKDEEEAIEESRVVPRMFEEDYMKYRAIIDIDGNSWSSRYGYILCYNSVIIKVESPNGYMSYYESELKPWEHYIPVHSNLSDIESAVSFAVSDDNVAKVRIIIKNAQSWCQAKLLEDQLAADLMWTLASYVELLNNEDGWHDVWEENVRAYNLTSMDMQEIR